MRPALTLSVRSIRDDLQIPVRGKRTQHRRSQGSSKVFFGYKSRVVEPGREKGGGVGNAQAVHLRASPHCSSI